MTAKIINFIKSFEEFKPLPYYADKIEEKEGILSIGYGTRFIKNFGVVTSTMGPITEIQATNYMTSDIAYIENCLSHRVFVFYNLTSYEIDATLSIAYNMGLNGIPKLLNFLVTNDLTGAAHEFMNGIYQNDNNIPIAYAGLCFRRASEYDIFTKGIYTRRTTITEVHKELFLEMNNGAQAIEVIKGLPMSTN